MSPIAEPVIKDALALRVEERCDLMDKIRESLDAIPLSEAWREEIARRLDDVRSGRVQTLSEEEFWAELDREEDSRRLENKNDSSPT